MNHKQPIALRGARPCLGTWLSIGSPIVAELAAECGFDWLLFDLEHGCGSEASLLGNLQAIRGTAAAGIVRVGAPHPDLILRALDWGADGIMVPHVESEEAAEACVRAVHYPPRGHRGLSRSGRAYGYGVRPVDENELPRPVFIAQIETLAGVSQARAIAAVDGVDMLFVGPTDLKFDLQVRSPVPPVSYEACLRTVIEAAGSAGKATGILVRNIEEVERLRALGFNHFAIDSDLAILRHRYQHLVALAKLFPEARPNDVPPAR